ncbi:hypothetical protein EV1_022362 [Malus domestica]
MCYVYENPYENSEIRSRRGSDGSYLDDRYRGYKRSRSDLGSDPYGKRYDVGPDAGMETVFMLTESTVDDVLRAKSMVDFGKKQHRTLNITVDLASIHIDALDVVSGNGHEHAIVYIGTSQGVYGARATINVWSPLIEHTHVRTKGDDLHECIKVWMNSDIMNFDRIFIYPFKFLRVSIAI